MLGVIIPLARLVGLLFSFLGVHMNPFSLTCGVCPYLFMGLHASHQNTTHREVVTVIPSAAHSKAKHALPRKGIVAEDMIT